MVPVRFNPTLPGRSTSIPATILQTQTGSPTSDSGHLAQPNLHSRSNTTLRPADLSGTYRIQLGPTRTHLVPALSHLSVPIRDRPIDRHSHRLSHSTPSQDADSRGQVGGGAPMDGQFRFAGFDLHLEQHLLGVESAELKPRCGGLVCGVQVYDVWRTRLHLLHVLHRTGR